MKNNAMSERILKSYTNIPQHLYVERSADRQLKSIIEEMQRPGYVLVARQMGKTNLLNNARRNLESDNRKFVYIDLSNNFNTERECYEFIIDSILDVLDDDLWEIRTDIEKLSSQARTDHVFYTRSLRKILKYLSKDLVIILDEIDALRTCDYSDNFFALIRSNYFARSNFEEFDRLTYILSGVIEPKDLIKDRNKSPFNIGEKIYLEDFSRKEFSTFIRQSKLDISDEIENYTFSWTKGNPRLTFDICAEIEKKIINGLCVTKEEVDNIINKKYLTSFDIAPIDHIRELVTDDKEIQESISKILSSNEEGITDKIKSKLYLYGIISSPSDDDKVIRIKNPIIEKSLTLSWLKSLLGSPSEIIDKARNLIWQSLDYHGAIELLSSTINSITDKQLLSISYYYLGYAEHQIGNYKLSNTYLEKSSFTTSDYPLLHYRTKLFTGLNHCKLKNYDIGCEALEYVVDNHKESMVWANAVLNLAVIIKDKEKSKRLLNEIINHTNDIQLDGEDTDAADGNFTTIKSYAYYYLYTLYDNVEQKDLYISEAIKLNIIHHIPVLRMIKGTLNGEEASEVISDIVNFIISKQIKLSYNNSATNIDYKYSIHTYIACKCFESNIPLFEEFIKYTIDDLNIDESIFIKDILLQTENKELKISILEYYIDKSCKNVDLTFFRYHVDNSILERKENGKYLIKYLDSLFSSETFEKEDIVTLSLVVKHILEGNYDDVIESKVQELINLVEKHTPSGLIYESSILCFWLFQYYTVRNDYSLVKLFGNEVIDRLSSPKYDKSIIDEEGEKSIKTFVLESLESQGALPIIKTYRKHKNYGRNEKVSVKYKDGTVVTQKYKKLEREIQAGTCEIID